MWLIDQFYVGCGTFFFFYRVMEIQLTNHTIYPLKMNNSVIFSIFTALCNHRHSLISEHFHHLKKKPHPNKEAVCNIPLPHGCWQHWSTSFLTLRICLFYTFSRQSLCDCTSLCVVLGFFFPSFSSSTFSFFVQIQSSRIRCYRSKIYEEDLVLVNSSSITSLTVCSFNVLSVLSLIFSDQFFAVFKISNKMRLLSQVLIYY